MEAVKCYLEVTSSKPVVWLFCREVLDSKAGSWVPHSRDISWSSFCIQFSALQGTAVSSCYCWRREQRCPWVQHVTLLSSRGQSLTAQPGRGNISNSVSLSSKSPSLWGSLQKGPEEDRVTFPSWGTGSQIAAGFSRGVAHPWAVASAGRESSHSHRPCSGACSVTIHLRWHPLSL